MWVNRLIVCVCVGGVVYVTCVLVIFICLKGKKKQKNKDFPGGSDSKASAYNAGDTSSIPAPGRSPGEGNGNPLWYSCLENPMDRESW